jgi:serine/threonine-protein kinase RsbW
MRPGDVVRLSFPAATAYVGVARSLAAGLATRLDFDLDHVEDLRLAVSEACSLLIPSAVSGSDLGLEVHIGHGDVTMQMSSATTATATPADDSFAWTVLRALADDATCSLDEGRLVIRLRFSSSAEPMAVDGPAGAERS